MSSWNNSHIPYTSSHKLCKKGGLQPSKLQYQAEEILLETRMSPQLLQNLLSSAHFTAGLDILNVVL